MVEQKVSIIYTIKDRATKAVGKLSNAIQRLSKIAFVALSAAIGKAIFDAARFEKGMANVFTLLDENTFRKFGKDLEAGALETMRKFGLGIEDVSKALFDTVSAGVEAGEAIDFLNEAARLAVGGVTEISVAVDGMTTVMNAWGRATFNATKTANVFFTAQKFGKTTVAELSSEIGKVASIAAKAGVSFEETASAMATLTLAGLRTDLAATALKGVISGLIKPSKQAEEQLRALGIPVGAVELKSKGLGFALKKVNEAFAENADVLAQIFPNIRAFLGAAGLSAEQLEKYDEILKATKTDTESLNNAFKKQQDTFDQQRKIFGSAIQVIGIQFGKKVNAVLKVFLKLFNNMSKGMQAGIVVFAGITLAAIALIPVIVGLAAAFVALGAGISLALLGVPILIAAIVAGITLLAFNFKKVSLIIENFILSADLLFTNFVLAILKGVKLIADALNKIPGVNIDVDPAIEALERINRGIETQKKLNERSLDEMAAKKDEAAKTDEERRKLEFLQEEEDRKKKAQALIDQLKKEKDIEDGFDEEKKAIEAIAEEEKKAQEEEALEEFKGKLLKMSEAEIEQLKVTEAEKELLKEAQERKKAVAQKKFGKTFTNNVALFTKEEGNIAKAGAKSILEITKNRLKAQLLAVAAEQASIAAGEIASVILAAQGFLRLAGATIIAGGAGTIDAIQLARGGSMIVDQPTRIGSNVVAGEAGAERIDVTPVDEAGAAQTLEINLNIDGEVVIKKILKIGQRERQEGILDDGLI